VNKTAHVMLRLQVRQKLSCFVAQCVFAFLILTLHLYCTQVNFPRIEVVCQLYLPWPLSTKGWFELKRNKLAAALRVIYTMATLALT
jgi:hypothetical protein